MPRQERIVCPHGWAHPLRSRSRLRAPVAGEPRPVPAGAPTAARRLRAGIDGGHHADRGQARGRRRAARAAGGQSHADRLGVPGSDRPRDRRDPPQPAQAGRELPGRQEPAHEDRRGGRRSIGARQPARRTDGDRVRPGRGRHGESRDRHDATVQAGAASPARSSAIERSTPTASSGSPHCPSRDVLLLADRRRLRGAVATTAGLFDAPLRDVVGARRGARRSATPQPDPPDPDTPTTPNDRRSTPWQR